MDAFEKYTNRFAGLASVMDALEQNQVARIMSAYDTSSQLGARVAQASLAANMTARVTSAAEEMTRTLERTAVPMGAGHAYVAAAMASARNFFDELDRVQQQFLTLDRLNVYETVQRVSATVADLSSQLSLSTIPLDGVFDDNTEIEIQALRPKEAIEEAKKEGKKLSLQSALALLSFLIQLWQCFFQANPQTVINDNSTYVDNRTYVFVENWSASYKDVVQEFETAERAEDEETSSEDIATATDLNQE